MSRSMSRYKKVKGRAKKGERNRRGVIGKTVEKKRKKKEKREEKHKKRQND